VQPPMNTGFSRVLTSLQAAFEAIFDALGGWRYKIESWTIIPLVEGLMRIWYHLDPRVYVQGLRIKRVSDGNHGLKSNKYVVFLIFSTAPLPAFTTNALAAIERSPFNLVIVSNASLDAYLRAELMERCHLLIERANVGRDFGGYKDALSLLFRRTPNIERIVLLNDSVFFFQRGLDRLFADLDGPHEFIGLTEVLQIHYHVQSFILSFGSNLVRSRVFRRFWKRYRPIGTRRWAIHKGEVGLTRRLTRAGYRPHILYQAAQLIPHLRSKPAREVLESVRLLPSFERRLLYRSFQQIVGTEDASEAEFEAISQGVRAVSAGPGGPRPAPLKGLGAQLEVMDRWSFEIFANNLIAMIAKRNQAHAGGFLFMRYLGMPVIKRDIFYREIYTLEEIHGLLSDLNEPLRDEAMSDLRRAGSAMYLRGLWRILYNHGSI
jgi:hypothetical protein